MGQSPTKQKNPKKGEQYLVNKTPIENVQVTPPEESPQTTTKDIDSVSIDIPSVTEEEEDYFRKSITASVIKKSAMNPELLYTPNMIFDDPFSHEFWGLPPRLIQMEPIMSPKDDTLPESTKENLNEKNDGEQEQAEQSGDTPWYTFLKTFAENSVPKEFMDYETNEGEVSQIQEKEPKKEIFKINSQITETFEEYDSFTLPSYGELQQKADTKQKLKIENSKRYGRLILDEFVRNLNDIESSRIILNPQVLFEWSSPNFMEEHKPAKYIDWAIVDQIVTGNLTKNYGSRFSYLRTPLDILSDENKFLFTIKILRN
jgi:hypothetical protein